MASIKWQDLLNVLTLKGQNTGKVKEVKKSSHDMKFQICLEANKSYLEEWLVEKTKIKEKSVSKSAEIRLDGNNFYKIGNDLEALRKYNLSVQFAPYNTNEFSLALSNRSAALGRLNHFKEAIQDIDRALKEENIEYLRPKLQIRKILLLHKLNLYQDCLDLILSLYPTEDILRRSNSPDLIKVYFDALDHIRDTNNYKAAESDVMMPLPKGGENKHFASASAHVLLKHSKEKGRHVITTEHFTTSDIIFVEKPFALVVLPDQYKSHCHNCCKCIIDFIPCKVCTVALYCNEECRDRAWTQYHQWECTGLEVCHSIGIAHLGLRVALMADSSDRYQQVFDLLTHIDDMKAEDVYQYCITAVLLTLYLEKYTSYFQSHPSLKIKDMGCRIFRHIAQLICNGHAITKIDSNISEKGCTSTVTEAKVRIATAIYPSASMMNHSCDQNISNSFINEYLIVRASRPIQKGEEVFNCYGPHYSRMNREERQNTLKKQYFFTCKCDRCSKSSESELQQFSALLCLRCSGPVMPGQSNCADCQRPQPLVELANLALTAQQKYNEGKELLAQGKIEEANSCLEKSVVIASKCLYKHNSDLRTYKDTLARVYAEKGNYKESIILVEECITSIGKQYGDQSIEVCGELLKLRDLLCKELCKLAEKGLHKEYRSKMKKMKRVIKQTKEIIVGNVDAAYLHSIPGMTETLKSIELTE